MKDLLLIVVALFVLSISNAHAEEITIGVKSAEPFTYQDADGQWQGLSIDLLNEIAKVEGFTYKIKELNSTPALIDAASDNSVDLSIAAISATAEREKVVDFSHTYYSTSLGILANSKASTTENFWYIGQRVVVVIAALIVLLYILGFIISRVDKGGEINGSHEGAWWALVTFSTTGYGDEVPVTNAGKVVASAWIIVSLFLISTFTATMSAVMTVKKLSESTTTLAALYDVKVNVVEGTTAEIKLAELGIENTAVPTLREAMENFKSGEVDVVVYDKAMLDYASRDTEGVDVHAIDNSDEYYAIALPSKSKLTEKVNLGILKTLSTPKWKATKAKYFGAE